MPHAFCRIGATFLSYLPVSILKVSTMCLWYNFDKLHIFIRSLYRRFLKSSGRSFLALSVPFLLLLYQLFCKMPKLNSNNLGVERLYAWLVGVARIYNCFSTANANSATALVAYRTSIIIFYACLQLFRFSDWSPRAPGPLSLRRPLAWLMLIALSERMDKNASFQWLLGLYNRFSRNDIKCSHAHPLKAYNRL